MLQSVDILRTYNSFITQFFFWLQEF